MVVFFYDFTHNVLIMCWSDSLKQTQLITLLQTLKQHVKLFVHNLINIHKLSPCPFVTSQPAHMLWKHVRNIKASWANLSENKERKLSYQSNMAKHKYFTALRWICVCLPHECISNMYEVISWQKLLQEKDESCFTFVAGSRPPHVYIGTCKTMDARRDSERCMWGKQASHVCLSQINIFYQSLN